MLDVRQMAPSTMSSSLTVMLWTACTVLQDGNCARSDSMHGMPVKALLTLIL